MDKEKMKKEIGKILDEAQEKTDSLKEELKDKLDETKEKIRYERKKMQMYVKDNPEKSVLVSAGIGAVVGMIIASLFRRRR